MVVEWTPIPYSFHDNTNKKRMANQLVSEVQEVQRKAAAGDQNAQVIMNQRHWYSAMQERLRRALGGAADMTADLLGATSINTAVTQNWDQGMMLIRQISDGDPKTIAAIESFNEYMKKGGDRKKYATLSLPLLMQPNGKSYGTSAKQGMVMQAASDYFRGWTRGDAPKARTFAGNLIGAITDATIDVWAARSLQRLAKRLRIPPMAEGSVAGDIKKDGTAGSAFGYGQEIFQDAADQLNMRPDELQAVVWFIEKDRWGENQWTTAAARRLQRQ